MNFDLKPCPFCGANAGFFVNNGVRIMCKVCEAQTMTLSDANVSASGGAVKRVADKWNKRVPPHWDYEITEMCPSCGKEVTLIWDTEKDGYKAYCPVCGERLMLCTACHDDGFACDYTSETDSCRHNPCGEEHTSRNIHNVQEGYHANDD